MTIDDELTELAARLSGDRWRTTHPDQWSDADWRAYRATPNAIFQVFEVALAPNAVPERPAVHPAVAHALFLRYLDGVGARPSEEGRA